MNTTHPSARSLGLLPAACLAVLGLVAALFLSSPTTAAAEEVEAKPERPTVLAVKFYAEWCGVCVRMQPTLDEVSADFADKAVLFVTLDLTDENTSNQARLMASALGIDRLWNDNDGKTGSLFLLDASDKSVKHTVTVQHSAEQIGTLLDEIL